MFYIVPFVFLALSLLAGADGTTSSHPSQTTASVVGDYNGPLRPQIHFSPPRGFMNDPNGLFRDGNDVYHLYFQLNPSALVVGNQHWGHATSNDLYHWANHPIAIAPETTEEDIFSGCAVIDHNNTSGFFPNQTNGVVAMYTLNTPVEQRQYIAYSRDGGYTFTKYQANPVISANSSQFRDPKMFWHVPTSRWVAVVAFAQEYVIGIWTSPNLRDWTHASNFTHSGLLGLQYECPSLVPMPMLKNGSLPLPMLLDSSNFVEDANIWLMYISINPGAPLGGSVSQYMPGHFDGTHFTPLDGAARLADFAKDNYAGQFFAEIPYNEPQLSMQWASNWQYADNVPTDSEGYRGTMALPRYHVLANTTRTPYALFSIPAPLSSLRTTGTALFSNAKLANTTSNFEYGSVNPSGALTFSMTAKNIPLQNAQGSLNFTILSSVTGEQIRGGYLLPGDATLFLDRSGVHGFDNPFFTSQFSAAHPIDQDTARFRMDVVIDRSLVEVFLDNGARSATMVYFTKGPMDTLVLGSGGLNASVSVQAEVWGLQSTWATGSGAASCNVSQIVQHSLLNGMWDA